jgi:hypothetical protein
LVKLARKLIYLVKKLSQKGDMQSVEKEKYKHIKLKKKNGQIYLKEKADERESRYAAVGEIESG